MGSFTNDLLTHKKYETSVKELKLVLRFIQLSGFHSQTANKFSGEKRGDLFHNCFAVENKKAVKRCFITLYGLV